MRLFTYLLIFLFINTSLLSDTTIGITLHDKGKDAASIRKIKRVVYDIFKDIDKRNSGHTNIIFINNKELALKNFVTFNKYDILIAYTNLYLKYQDKLKKVSKRPFIFTRKNKQKLQMILLANKKSNIKSIKDIKDKTYVSYMVSNQANIWLDYLSRNRLSKSYKKLVKSEYSIRKNSRRVLDVYFKKADFTVVPSDVYKDMLELNPSLKNNLLIVEKSEPTFYYMIGLFHKNTKKSVMHRFNKVIKDEINSERLSQIFRAVEAFYLYDTTFEEFKELENFYKKYKELEKKTGL